MPDQVLYPLCHSRPFQQDFRFFAAIFPPCQRQPFPAVPHIGIVRTGINAPVAPCKAGVNLVLGDKCRVFLPCKPFPCPVGDSFPCELLKLCRGTCSGRYLRYLISPLFTLQSLAVPPPYHTYWLPHCRGLPRFDP